MNLTLENYNTFVDSNNRSKQNNNKPKQNKLTNKNGPKGTQGDTKEVI
jgi:hypothetical protein